MQKFLTSTRFHFVILLCLLFAATWFSNSNNDIRQRLQFIVFDQYNKMYPRERTDGVLIVDLDEVSLEKIGQWPWSRNVVASLVTNLTEAGARVIAFDGVFAEPDRSSPSVFVKGASKDIPALASLSQEEGSLPDYDGMFAEAIKKSGIFVTAFTYGDIRRSQSTPVLRRPFLAKTDARKDFLEHAAGFEAAATNLRILSENAAGNGSFMAKADPDGVLRRAGMVFSDGKNLYPSLSLEALRVAIASPSELLHVAKVPEDKKGLIDTSYRILVSDHVIPVEKDGLIRVYYRDFDRQEKDQSKDYLSAYKVLDSAYKAEVQKRVAGRVVFIGTSVEGLKDLRTTPLGPLRPGVEVHANIVEQVLQDKYLIRPAIADIAEAMFVFLSGFVFILLTPFMGVFVLGLVCTGMIASVFFGAIKLYTDMGLLLDPLYPGMAVAMIFIVSTLLKHMRSETVKKQYRNMLGVYVSEGVMDELIDDPHKLKLGGQVKDITVMFTDIRSFTTISESLSPEALIQLMNDFLTPMTTEVLETRGTIDKYMGDAMMAFWNAPQDVEEHARKACMAALKMNAVLGPLNESLKVAAEAERRPPITLKAGIGINTGPASVGNMGSEQRFAYSALGDTVNLASRLEGQTKTYGVDILIGEETQKHVQDFALLELDLLRVKGKMEPVRVFTLLGDEQEGQKEEFLQWKAAHEQMLAFYREQKFGRALTQIDKCKELSGVKLRFFYDMYRQRIENMRFHPPGDDWDGVFVATSK